MIEYQEKRVKVIRLAYFFEKNYYKFVYPKKLPANVCCVAAIVKNSFFSLGVLKYVVCLCRGCDGCCVFYLYCEAWSCSCLCIGREEAVS